MYVVKLPLNIGGKRRRIGELIDDSEVTSKELVSSGYLVKVDGKASAPEEDSKTGKEILIPVLTETGEESLVVSESGVAEAVKIMQLSQTEALEAVKTAESDALIILELCSGNAKIKAAARKRGTEISEAEEKEGKAGED